MCLKALLILLLSTTQWPWLCIGFVTGGLCISSDGIFSWVCVITQKHSLPGWNSVSKQLFATFLANLNHLCRGVSVKPLE